MKRIERRICLAQMATCIWTMVKPQAGKDAANDELVYILFATSSANPASLNQSIVYPPVINSRKINNKKPSLCPLHESVHIANTLLE